MMNALNLLFHRSTLPLSNSLSLSHRCYSTDSCSFTRFTDSFSQYPNANLVAAFLGCLPKFVFRQLSVTIPSKQTSSKTSVSSTLSLLAYLAPKPTCDVASFSDYSRLETAKRDRCCPENRAICSDVWKRHSLAPATRHMNIQDQGRRQQETHTPTAKTIYRRNVRSPTTRHRIRNEKRARNQREFHYTSSDVLSDISDPIRHFRSILIYPTQRSSPEGSLIHV